MADEPSVPNTAARDVIESEDTTKNIEQRLPVTVPDVTDYDIPNTTKTGPDAV